MCLRLCLKLARVFVDLTTPGDCSRPSDWQQKRLGLGIWFMFMEQSSLSCWWCRLAQDNVLWHNYHDFRLAVKMSQLFQFHLTTLGIMFTQSLCHFGNGQTAVMLYSWGGNHRPDRSKWQPSARFMTKSPTDWLSTDWDQLQAQHSYRLLDNL